MTSLKKSVVSEKRKHPRFSVDLPIQYKKSNLLTKYGRAANASLGGMLVHLPEEMGIGQQLPLQIFFPSRSELNNIETSVQVVWKRIAVRRDWTWDYRTGVRFVDISPEEMTHLKNFLMSLA